MRIVFILGMCFAREWHLCSSVNVTVQMAFFFYTPFAIFDGRCFATEKENVFLLVFSSEGFTFTRSNKSGKSANGSYTYTVSLYSIRIRNLPGTEKRSKYKL